MLDPALRLRRSLPPKGSNLRLGTALRRNPLRDDFSIIAGFLRSTFDNQLVVIRLAARPKKRPFYNVVVADSRIGAMADSSSASASTTRWRPKRKKALRIAHDRIAYWTERRARSFPTPLQSREARRSQSPAAGRLNNLSETERTERKSAGSDTGRLMGRIGAPRRSGWVKVVPLVAGSRGE